MIALAIFTLPLVAVVTIATVSFTSMWTWLLSLLGIGFGVALSGFGVASVVSARVVFPVPAPGDNPFQTPPGAGISSTLAAFVTWGLVGALALPELVLGIVSITTGSVLLGVASLVLGLVLGSTFAVLGIRIVGATLDRKAPELLASLMRAS